MSDVIWHDSGDRVTFLDDKAPASQALQKEVPASDLLQSHVQIKAATLSGIRSQASSGVLRPSTTTMVDPGSAAAPHTAPAAPLPANLAQSGAIPPNVPYQAAVLSAEAAKQPPSTVPQSGVTPVGPSQNPAVCTQSPALRAKLAQSGRASTLQGSSVDPATAHLTGQRLPANLAQSGVNYYPSAGGVPDTELRANLARGYDQPEATDPALIYGTAYHGDLARRYDQPEATDPAYMPHYHNAMVDVADRWVDVAADNQRIRENAEEYGLDYDPYDDDAPPGAVPPAGRRKTRGRKGKGRFNRAVYGKSVAAVEKAMEDDPTVQGLSSIRRGYVQAATAAKRAGNAVGWTWKTSLRLIHGAKDLVSMVRTMGLVKTVLTLLQGAGAAVIAAATPLLMGLGIALILLALIVAVISVVAVGTDMSFGSSSDMVETLYNYCAEKDTELTVQIRQKFIDSPYIISQLSYNGELVTDPETFEIATDIDLLLAYLQVVSTDGTHTQEELEAQIDALYAELYQIEEETIVSGGNSIANAAVMLAYEHPRRNDNGTPLYQAVHDLTQNNSLYQSCDRVACTIIRWSGADDNFPTGLAGMVYTYLRDDGQGTGKDHWQKLPDDWTRDDLLPGDVLIWRNHHHVFIYVGHDLIEAKYPDLTDEDYCIVEGSYGSPYAAACVKWDRLDNNSYVYRNIKSEDDPKYVDGIEGIDPTVAGKEVSITAQTVEQYVAAHTTPEQQERMELMAAFGTYAGYAAAGNPFGSGEYWEVTERFGPIAVGTTIVRRTAVTVAAVPGQQVYSPLTGTLAWTGTRATITSETASGSVHEIRISGLTPAAEAGPITAGLPIGTAAGDIVTISYEVDGEYVNPAMYLSNAPAPDVEP